jgi:hypothetical protein
MATGNDSINSFNYKSLKNELKDDQRSVRRQRTKMEEVEYELINYLKKENNSERNYFETSVKILNSMNLNDTMYFKVLDMFVVDENCKKFSFLPEDKRMPFILYKLKN